MKRIFKQYSIFLILLGIVFMIAAAYTFNEKLDLNGDNCYYYIYAKSIASGNGYSDLSSPGKPLTNNFPPGYPLLMAPLLLFSDSIILQNLLGEFLLLGCSLISFFLLIKAGVNKYISLFASVLILFNQYNLQFATMSMSELPFAFFSLLTFYLAQIEDVEQVFYKSKSFWLLLLCSVLTYHIRTQGIILLFAVLIHYLSKRNWIKTIASILSFILLILPWLLRNKLKGLGASRYLDQIFLQNVWDPEKGNLTVGQVIKNAFSYFQSFVDTYLPNTIFPFLNDGPTQSKGYFIVGVFIIGLMIYGCWQLKKIRYLLISFILGNFALISLWSSNSPSEYRYLVCFLPIVITTFYYGLCFAIKRVFFSSSEKNAVWISLTIVLSLLSFKSLGIVHDQNKDEYPPNYENFVSISEYANENLPENAIYCVRKPELFYMFGKRQSVKYLFSSDAKKVIDNLVESKVDYVVLDQLGYSSTPKFLYPAIQKYPYLFTPVFETGEPKFYLLKFDKEKAKLIK